MTNKPTWEIEFYTKFGADKIWVKPSKDNVQTIFDIENFISTKLAEQRKELIEKIEELDEKMFAERGNECGATATDVINLIKQD